IGSGSPAVTNAGLIKKSSCTSCTNSSSIQVALTVQSGGQVQVLAGNLLFGNITSTGGAFSVSSGATMYTYYTSTSSFNATASISITGTSQTWTGGTVGGSGTLTIPNGTTIDINGSTYFDTKAVSNSGTLNYNNGTYSYFYNSATLTNTSTGIVDIKGDS